MISEYLLSITWTNQKQEMTSSVPCTPCRPTFSGKLRSLSSLNGSCSICVLILTVAKTPSSCRAPWLDTSIPSMPYLRASLASSAGKNKDCASFRYHELNFLYINDINAWHCHPICGTPMFPGTGSQPPWPLTRKEHRRCMDGWMDKTLTTGVLPVKVTLQVWDFAVIFCRIVCI